MVGLGDRRFFCELTCRHRNSKLLCLSWRTPTSKIPEIPVTQTRGKFVWHDLTTPDPKSAEIFYTDVIGWTSQDSGMTHQPYTLFLQGSTMVAGLMATPLELAATGVPPNWTGHIAVPDVDEYTARVEATGGKIRRPPADIPTIGRFSVVEDPHGAVFILFRGNGSPVPDPEPNTPGYIGWNELHAGDGDTAWSFYEALFGWRKVSDFDMGPMGNYKLFAPAGETSAVGGMMTKMPQTPVPFWLYYFNVVSASAAIDRAKAGGAQLIMGPHQVPGGQWIAQFLDPQGAMFAVVSFEP
jgi:predicted enzyme related to lactoylglutathione lyase